MPSGSTGVPVDAGHDIAIDAQLMQSPTPATQGSKDDRYQIKHDHSTVQLALLLAHTTGVTQGRMPYALWQPSPRSCCH